MNCNHEWGKALDQSGMYFINVCRKCGEQEPYVAFELTEMIRERITKAMLETKITGQATVLITEEEMDNLKQKDIK